MKTAYIWVVGRVNGMGELDPAGSYVKVGIREGDDPGRLYYYLSEGAAAVLGGRLTHLTKPREAAS